MNRFKFRFANVLRYREIIEDNNKREFGAALDHLRHEEERMNLIDGSIEGHERLMEESAQGRISARDLQNKYNFARNLDRKRETQEAVLRKSHSEMENQREKLVEATKQKKIFERIRERDLEAYDQEVRKEEQKISDELSTQRYTIDKKPPSLT